MLKELCNEMYCKLFGIHPDNAVSTPMVLRFFKSPRVNRHTILSESVFDSSVDVKNSDNRK